MELCDVTERSRRVKFEYSFVRPGWGAGPIYKINERDFFACRQQRVVRIFRQNNLVEILVLDH